MALKEILPAFLLSRIMSSAFRVKDKKIAPRDSRTTLNARHTDMVRTIQHNTQLLADKEQLLETLNSQLEEVINLFTLEFGTTMPTIITPEQLQRRTTLVEQRVSLQDRIIHIEQEISTITPNADLHQYYLRTGDILCTYFEHDSTLDNRGALLDQFNHALDPQYLSSTFLQQSSTTTTTNSLSLLATIDPSGSNAGVLRSTDYVDGISFDSIMSDNTLDGDDAPPYADNDNGTTSSTQRTQLATSSVTQLTPSQPPTSGRSSRCRICQSEMVIVPSEGIMSCTNPSCSVAENIMIDNDKPSYKDPPPEVSSFNYKRMNHLNECLAQFQAKETTEIPDEVYDHLYIEIHKDRIQNLATLTHRQIRAYLKKLGYNRYYEHVPHILNRITGIPPLEIDKDLEERIRTMFREIQPAFNKHCPPERKNFISYNYIIHKILELLGHHELAAQFPLLKSRQKLYEAENIWQKITEELGWAFIRAI